MFMPSCKNINYNTIQEAIADCDKIEVIIENESKVYDNISTEFDNILNLINNMLKSSHEMPAFGVSLHNETMKAKQTGVWLELYYDNTCMNNDMPFDSLLIQVEPEYTGFNIIRKNNGMYDGRCFYIDLINNNMEQLYDEIKD